MIYIYIGFAGALGAIARYALGILIVDESFFPISTLLCNLAGCYALAYITSSTLPISGKLKNAIGTGFIGSFTTFSAFSVETITLIDSDQIGFAILYIIVSVIGGIIVSNIGWKNEVGK